MGWRRSTGTSRCWRRMSDVFFWPETGIGAQGFAWRGATLRCGGEASDGGEMETGGDQPGGTDGQSGSDDEEGNDGGGTGNDDGRRRNLCAGAICPWLGTFLPTVLALWRATCVPRSAPGGTCVAPCRAGLGAPGPGRP